MSGIATGEAYTAQYQPNYIFFNVGGQLQNSPGWSSSGSDACYDVQFVDIERDGDLDLAFLAGGGPVAIHLNEGGVIDPVAGWTSAVSDNGNSFDFADLNGDGLFDLGVANNLQLGGRGHFDRRGHHAARARVASVRARPSLSLSPRDKTLSLDGAHGGAARNRANTLSGGAGYRRFGRGADCASAVCSSGFADDNFGTGRASLARAPRASVAGCSSLLIAAAAISFGSSAVIIRPHRLYGPSDPPPGLGLLALGAGILLGRARALTSQSHRSTACLAQGELACFCVFPRFFRSRHPRLHTLFQARNQADCQEGFKNGSRTDRHLPLRYFA